MFRTALIICEQTCLFFPLILGSYLSFSLMKIPDLSIESAYVFGAILASFALPLLYHLPIIFGILIVLITALCGGAIVGLISSLLTQKGKIPHLLSSILTIGLFHGINQYVLGKPLYSLSTMVNPLESDILITITPELFVLLIIFGISTILGFFFFQTQIGNALAVYGNNPKFFKHFNISTKFVFIFGICLANALAGLAGYLDAQSTGFVDINMGLGKALLCITVLILGKVVVNKKQPISIVIPIIGTIIYTCLQQFLLKIGFNLKYFTMIQTIIVLTILVLHHKHKNNQSRTNTLDNLGI